MRPNAYGSSTIGVKKSAVWTIAMSSLRATTPASSAVPAATSTRGSVGAGRPATIGRSAAAESLHPQPAPCERGGRAGAMGTYDARGPPRRQQPEAEIEAAVQVMSDPERLETAQRVVATAAPSLQAILEQALDAADWFGSAHRAQVMEATGHEDPM